MVETSPAGEAISNGSAEFDLVAGQSLKVETSPKGEELLEAECPAGKKWSVILSVRVAETDA